MHASEDRVIMENHGNEDITVIMASIDQLQQLPL
jgi:hypothetical protein